MIKIIKRLLKILHIKWVKGECTRLCAWCSYRHECMEHFEG